VSRFVTPLRVEEIDDKSADGRGSWQLLDPLVYQSDVLAAAGLAWTITVPADFITDFASVPRLPVAFLLCGDVGHKAAVVHDFLYTAQVCDRQKADAVLAEAMEVCGVPGWRRGLMWAGVRIGGGSHWTAPGQEQPEHVVAQLEAA
jgi:hypothetical protein